MPSLPPPGNTGPFPTGYLKHYRPYLRLPREQTTETKPLKVQPGYYAGTRVLVTIFQTVTNLTGISKYLVSVLPASSLRTHRVWGQKETMMSSVTTIHLVPEPLLKHPYKCVQHHPVTCSLAEALLTVRRHLTVSPNVCQIISIPWPLLRLLGVTRGVG